METKIEVFNWDLKWFLSNLEAFQNGLNTSNGDTLDLLGKIAKAIDKIGNYSKKLDCNVKTDIVNWVTINEDVFELERSIFCRICKKSFPASCRDYILHVASGEHNSVLVKYSNECDRLSRMTPNESSVNEDRYSNSRNASMSQVSSPTVDRNSDTPIRSSRKRLPSTQNGDLSDCSTPKRRDNRPSDRSESDVKPDIKKLSAAIGQSQDQQFTPSGATPKRRNDSQVNHGEVDIKPDIKSLSALINQNRQQESQPLSNIATSKSPARQSDRNEIDVKPNIKTLSASISETTSNDDTTSKNEFAKLKVFFEEELQTFIGSAVKKNSKMMKSEKYAGISADIESLLKCKFKSIDCRLLGSRINGTTITVKAPLDICAILEEKHLENSRNVLDHIMKRDTVEKLLAENEKWENAKNWSRIGHYFVSAKHAATQIECNFMLTCKNFIKNNSLVKCFFDVQPLCSQLVLCIRKSMKVYDKPTSWTKEFSGYLISLLVIFYFQVTKRLPSVWSLQKDFPENPDTYEGFNPPRDVVPSTDSLSELLKGFFEYYSNFEFTTNIVNVYLGFPVNRDVLMRTKDRLSTSLYNLKATITKPPTAEYFSNKQMCVQDIFLRRRNAAEPIGLDEIQKFKEYCNESLRILRNAETTIQY